MKFILFYFVLFTLVSCTTDLDYRSYLPTDLQSQVANYTGRIAVVQNMTTDSQTILTFLKHKNESLTYKISNNNKELQPQFTANNSVHKDYEVVQVALNDLSSTETYRIDFFDSSGKAIDSRIFSTLNNKKENFKIAVASCARVGWVGGDLAKPSVWDELAEQLPDALIFLGDFVYPDSILQATFHIKPSFEQIQEKYVEAWKEIRFYHQAKLIPVFSILDDHDYGFQGANRRNNAEKMDLIKNFFRSFYPLYKNADTFVEGPGAAFAIDLFGFKLVLLDNKYYRIAQAEDEHDGPIWGPDQLKWLRGQLDKDNRPTLIGSGTLITFPVKNPDAAMYESPEEFKEFAKALTAAKSKALILTGDVHYSAANKIKSDHFGYPTYEITASRIHSISPLIIPPFISGKVDSSEQLVHSAEKNFVILQGKNGQFKNMKMEIHNKNDKSPISATLFAD